VPGGMGGLAKDGAALAPTPACRHLHVEFDQSGAA